MKNILFLITPILFLVGCNAGKNQTNIELVRQMMDQPSLKAQDWDPRRGGQAGQLMPPENTVARGENVYPYGMADGDKAAVAVKNPYKGPMTPEMVERGQSQYKIYCGVCHGDSGDAKSAINEVHRQIKSLLTDRARGFSDGRIYHIIMAGSGLMGSYANQVSSEEDRWAIVNYVRLLQKQSK